MGKMFSYVQKISSYSRLPTYVTDLGMVIGCSYVLSVIFMYFSFPRTQISYNIHTFLNVHLWVGTRGRRKVMHNMSVLNLGYTVTSNSYISSLDRGPTPSVRQMSGISVLIVLDWYLIDLKGSWQHYYQKKSDFTYKIIGLKKAPLFFWLAEVSIVRIVKLTPRRRCWTPNLVTSFLLGT